MSFKMDNAYVKNLRLTRIDAQFFGPLAFIGAALQPSWGFVADKIEYNWFIPEIAGNINKKPSNK